MQQKYKKKNTKKRSPRQKISAQSELRSWADIISEKILTDYALPITKNAEIRLHQLNEKIEHSKIKI